jgi:hypothetical protein
LAASADPCLGGFPALQSIRRGSGQGKEPIKAESVDLDSRQTRQPWVILRHAFTPNPEKITGTGRGFFDRQSEPWENLQELRWL